MKICEFCGRYPAIHLESAENGPMFGLALENDDAEGNPVGSDKYCSHECWESDVKIDMEMERSD